MKSKDLAFVALRVLAIYYLIAALYTLLTSLSAGLTFDLSNQLDNYATTIFYFSLIPSSLYLVAAIVLWVFSDRLSQYVSNENLNSETNSTMKIEDIQVILFASIGLYLVFSSLPYIGGTLYKIIEMKNSDKYSLIPNETLTDTISLSLEILLGIILFFGAKGFSGLLTWARSLGLKSK